MSYYFKTTLNTNWQDAKEKITEALKAEGFGILTEIDMAGTLKNKLDVNMKPYTILGACNPGFAHKAVNTEEYIGTMLPCNVIMKENNEGAIEVAAVDPVASMQAVVNDNLAEIAEEVKQKLKKVIESL